MLQVRMSSWIFDESGTLGHIAVSRKSCDLLQYLLQQAPQNPEAMWNGLSTLEYLFGLNSDHELLKTMFEMLVTAWPHDCSGMLRRVQQSYVPQINVTLLDEMILCGADETVLVKSALKKK
jgi:hypothetical protein